MGVESELLYTNGAADAEFGLLCIADEQAEAGAELLAFADEVLITPDAVLEDVVGQGTIWSFTMR